jgi:hypothetical protein
MDREQMHDLADRLREEGDFELYLDNHTNERSKRVWLTERERDAIVNALYFADGAFCAEDRR